MYQILIVDDDLLFRTQLKNMIDHQLTDYTVSAQASNGEEALALLKEKMPDLMITDVEMPDMDGMELVSRVKKLGLELPIIVLSNYDSYQYVKSTLKNGAMDYILKHELSCEVLQEQLNRAAQLLQRKRSTVELQTENAAESYMWKNMTALRNEFLQRLLTRRIPAMQDLKKHMEILDIHLGTKRIRTCLMVLNQYPAKVHSMTPEQISLLDYAVLNITEEILNDSGDGFAGSLGGGQFLLLFSFDNQRSEALIHSRSNEIISRLSFCMENYLNETVSFCLDRELRDIWHIDAGYSYVRKLQDKRFFYRDDCILQEPGEELEDPLMGLPMEAEKRIFNALEQGSGYEPLLQAVFSRMENRQMSLDNAQMTIYDLISLANRFAKEHQVPLEQIYGTERNIEVVWKRFERVEDAREFCLQIFDRLNEAVQSQTEEQADSRYVRQVVRIVREHYGEELSLAEIADQLGISKGYLSKIFKEEMGIGFANFLTDYRVDRSIQLMQQQKYMLYEIAELCGFREYPYFASVFKRKTGKSPREYMGTLMG